MDHIQGTTTVDEALMVAAREEHIQRVMGEMASRPTPLVPVSEDLLTALVWAQARHTGLLLLDPYNRMGDDWGDDTNGALDLMRTLFDLAWDQSDLVGLDAWLNTPYVEGCTEIVVPRQGTDVSNSGIATSPTGLLPLQDIGGCDGYASELVELDCPAMPKESE